MNQLFSDQAAKDGYKACELCGEYNINLKAKNKNPLSTILCGKCHIRGAAKIRCVNCKTQIPIIKDLQGQINKYCLMCYLSRIKTV